MEETKEESKEDLKEKAKQMFLDQATKGSKYKPEKGDDVDKRLSEVINKKSLFGIGIKRTGPGKYELGK